MDAWANRGGQRSPLHFLAGVLCLTLPIAASACTTRDVVAVRQTHTNTDAARPTLDASQDSSTTTVCNALFCSSFETGVAQYDQASSAGDLSTVNSPVFLGDSALAANSIAPGGRAVIQVDLSAVPADTLYLRAYVWVPSTVPLDDVTLFHLGQAGDQYGVNIDVQSQQRFELFAVESNVSQLSDPGALQLDRWMCLQLALTISDTDGAAILNADGTEVARAMAVDTRPPNGVVLFTLGVDWSSAQQQPLQVFFDDVVLDTMPVGCL